jgi:hypothetical protein
MPPASGATARAHIATGRRFGGSDRIPHGPNTTCPIQIIEVRGAGRTIRAKRRDGDQRTRRASSVARVREPRIAVCARVIIGAHDDLPAGMVLPDHPGDRSEIAGVEGNGDGVPGCRVNAGAGGVALGDADHFAGYTNQEVQAGDAPALQESLRSACADLLVVMFPMASRQCL